MSARAAALAVALLAAPAAPRGGAHAQSAPAPQAAPVAVPAISPEAHAAPVPLLWAAERGGHVVYLLGSFHLLAPGDYPLSPDVDAAFADAESLLFELSPAEMASPTLAVRMGQAALRTDGTRLDSALPVATRGALGAWVQAHAAELATKGMTAQNLQMFEPWFVGLVVGIFGMTEGGLDPALGLDRHFAAAAVAAGKPAGGFETGDEQIAFLDGMDPAEQLQFLDEALADAAPGNDDDMTLHALWRAGDADAMWARLGEEMQRDYPRLYQRIDVERNATWLPEIEQRLQGTGDDDTLVVVGALHLLGPDGLVERLRADGYDVRRICSACAAPGVAP
ncbi:MAG TPA: TraB/GumN family protein [Luteimonas sp.]|nr:TraB/GumN family protein [Luteimonas sp.]